MKNQKGNILVIGIIVAALLLGGGLYLYKNNQTANTDILMEKDEKALMDEEKKDEMIVQDIEKTTDQVLTNRAYTGNVLAGKTTPYLEFNHTDYEKAQKEGKIIFLDFYANWCPICRGEAPDLQAGFDQLSRADVVGFQVNYNDSETDDYEKKLAKDFGVTYQHTKVILKDNIEVLKDSDTWDTQKLVSEINKI